MARQNENIATEHWQLHLKTSDDYIECIFPDFFNGFNVTNVTKIIFDVSAETGVEHFTDV